MATRQLQDAANRDPTCRRDCAQMLFVDGARELGRANRDDSASQHHSSQPPPTAPTSARETPYSFNTSCGAMDYGRMTRKLQMRPILCFRVDLAHAAASFASSRIRARATSRGKSAPPATCPAWFPGKKKNASTRRSKGPPRRSTRRNFLLRAARVGSFRAVRNDQKLCRTPSAMVRVLSPGARPPFTPAVLT